jgi:hypothetical protein
VGAVPAILAGLYRERQQLICQGVFDDVANSCSVQFTFRPLDQPLRPLAKFDGGSLPAIISKSSTWAGRLPSAGQSLVPLIALKSLASMLP